MYCLMIEEERKEVGRPPVERVLGDAGRAHTIRFGFHSTAVFFSLRKQMTGYVP